MLYLLAVLIGTVIGGLISQFFPADLEYHIYNHLSKGSQVVIAIDDRAYIYKMVDGKLDLQVSELTMLPMKDENDNNLPS